MSILFHNKTNGIVNVKMVITEEKILSNIDKIHKLINPKSKKQIIELEEDSYFKDLVESVKAYLIEYPKKNNFPSSVYDAAFGLVEYATNQFEENTKTIEDLIRKREKNIKLASVLRDATKVVKAKAKNWKEIVKKLEPKYSPDVAEALVVIGKSKDTDTEEYKKACKDIEIKISNLESNLHIEIDMERIEDTSKALSYIGIEIAEALKYIPSQANNIDEAAVEEKPKAKKTTAKATKTTKAKATKVEQTEQENVDDDNTPKASGKALGKGKNANKDIDAELDEETQEVGDIETEEDYEEEAEEVEESEDVVEQKVSKASAKVVSKSKTKNIQNVEVEKDDFEEAEYIEDTRFEKKPSLWQRIKNSKFVRTVNYILKIRVVLDYPALPDADSNK